MRRLVLLMLLIAGLARAERMYSFEKISERQQPIPLSIAAVVRAADSEAWQNCRAQLGLTEEAMESSFTGVLLTLSETSSVLVLPTERCFAYFGAHSVSFWLILLDGQHPRLVMSGRQDALAVLGTMSQGLPDIETHYGQTSTRFTFNGKSYTGAVK